MAGHGSDAKNGTFIGAMGLKLHNTTIEVSVNEDGEMKGASFMSRAQSYGLYQRVAQTYGMYSKL